MCSAPVRTGRILCENCEKPRKRRTDSPEIQQEAPPATTSVTGSPSGIRVEGLAALFEGTGMEALIARGDEIASISSVAAETLHLSGDATLQTLRDQFSIDLSSSPDGVYDLTISGSKRKFVIASIGPELRVLALVPEVTEEAPALEFLRETVIHPLRSLGQSLEASSKKRGTDPILRDAASTIEQALSSLELSPDLGGGATDASEDLTIAGILENVRSRFLPLATQKQISLTIDASSGGDRKFVAPGALGEALATYVENSLRYTPIGGQSVLGVREMEHKGNPIHLFFVMDNGPVVPDEYREAIFSPGFVWDPASSVRTGRDLAQCRRFATKHGGKAWVESRTGRACTFYLSVAREP